MNLVRGSLERRNGGTWLKLGSHELKVPDEVTAQRAALSRYDGRSLVVGLRPEDMDDASILQDKTREGATIPATIDLAEAMGSEVVVHFEVDAPAVLTEDTKELAGDVGAEELERLQQRAEAARSEFVGRFDPRTRVKEREQVQVAIDTTRLHFFDEESGLAIWDGTES